MNRAFTWKKYSMLEIFLVFFFMIWSCQIEEISCQEATAMEDLHVPADSSIQKVTDIDVSGDPVDYMFRICNSYCVENERRMMGNTTCVWENLQCLRCECDKTCEEFGDCCPDENGNVKKKKSRVQTCVGQTHTYGFKYKYGYFMVKSCPEVSTGRKLRMADDNNIFPVTSTITKKTYFNHYYAECNNENWMDLEPWLEKNDCDTEAPSGDGFDIDDIHGSGESWARDCFSEFSPLGSVNSRSCEEAHQTVNTIAECNITGQWALYDKKIESYCFAYNNPVFSHQNVFRNIFCFLCNGNVLNNTYCYPEIMRSFSVESIDVLWTGNTDETSSKKSQIGTDWFDSSKGEFRNVYCSSGREMVGEECRPVGDAVVGDQYFFQLVLIPQDKNDMIPSKDMEEFVGGLQTVFTNLMKSLHSTEFVYTLAEFKTLPFGIRQSLPGSSVYYYLSVDFVVNTATSRDQLENDLWTALNEPWILPFKNRNLTFSSKVFLTKDFMLSNTSFQYESHPTCCDRVAWYYLSGDRLILVSGQTMCPFVRLQAKSDFELEENGDIFLTYINISLPMDNFTYEDSNNVIVCLDKLPSVLNDSLEISESQSSVKSIVSLVCICLSMVCLVLTFITYCIFPSLRTLPGKNNMFLICVLFLAQLLFMVGATRTNNEVVCQVIGMVLHYLWLSVIFWMNVCSFHMFHVFVMGFSTSTMKVNNVKKLLKYALFAHGVPLLIVSATVGSSLAISDGMTTGYGGSVCYLNSFKLIVYAFLLPLGAVIVCNVVFFILTICAISRTKQMKKAAGRERRNIYVYIKLSVLTGVFWTVAIVSSFTKLNSLVYLAIVLNGSQGVLIFASYMLNKRVFHLWAGVCSQVYRKSEKKSESTKSTGV